MSEIRSFNLDVPETEIDELKARLNHARWPDSETVDDWTQGVPVFFKVVVTVFSYSKLPSLLLAQAYPGSRILP